MEYTVEERREAFEKNMLWVRFPDSGYEHIRTWTLLSPDSPRVWCDFPGAEYFIGESSPDISDNAQADTAGITSPTLEEKALALLQKRLWWRFPKSSYEHARQWGNVWRDVPYPGIAEIIDPDTEYFIGDMPPTTPENVHIILDLMLIQKEIDDTMLVGSVTRTSNQVSDHLVKMHKMVSDMISKYTANEV